MRNFTERTTFKYRSSEIFGREHDQILNDLALTINAVSVKRGIISTLEFKRISEQALKFECWKERKYK